MNRMIINTVLFAVTVVGAKSLGAQQRMEQSHGAGCSWSCNPSCPGDAVMVCHGLGGVSCDVDTACAPDNGDNCPEGTRETDCVNPV